MLGTTLRREEVYCKRKPSVKLQRMSKAGPGMHVTPCRTKDIKPVLVDASADWKPPLQDDTEEGWELALIQKHKKPLKKQARTIIQAWIHELKQQQATSPRRGATQRNRCRPEEVLLVPLLCLISTRSNLLLFLNTTSMMLLCSSERPALYVFTCVCFYICAD